MVRAALVVADFGDHESAITNAKRGAGGVIQLRAADPGASRVAIEHGSKQAETLHWIDPDPNGRSAERITWSARRQVRGRQGRPTEGAVDEEARARRAQELGANGLLADPYA